MMTEGFGQSRNCKKVLKAKCPALKHGRSLKHVEQRVFFYGGGVEKLIFKVESQSSICYTYR